MTAQREDRLRRAYILMRFFVRLNEMAQHKVAFGHHDRVAFGNLIGRLEYLHFDCGTICPYGDPSK